MKSRRLLPAPDAIVAVTRLWIERAVIGLNLCPFAQAVYAKHQIRYVVSEAEDPGALLGELERELRFLAETTPETVETTLLIHPHVLTDFLDYNDFISIAEAAIDRLGFSGVLQIATFHPAYQFGGTTTDDMTNSTNRSPYPMLHVLREESMSRAVAALPKGQDIFRKNIETMRRLGVAGWDALGVTAPAARKP